MIIAAVIMLVDGYAVYTAAENSILIQNVLADNSGNAGSGESDEGDEGDTVLDFMTKHFGCDGGKSKCFKGEISFRGASLSGLWYVDKD